MYIMYIYICVYIYIVSIYCIYIQRVKKWNPFTICGPLFFKQTCTFCSLPPCWFTASFIFLKLDHPLEQNSINRWITTKNGFFSWKKRLCLKIGYPKCSYFVKMFPIKCSPFVLGPTFSDHQNGTGLNSSLVSPWYPHGQWLVQNMGKSMEIRDPAPWSIALLGSLSCHELLQPADGCRDGQWHGDTLVMA
jgi:hypothetical protein